MRRSIEILLAATVLFGTGCSEQPAPMATEPVARQSVAQDAGRKQVLEPPAGGERGPALKKEQAPEQKPQPRKVVYTGEVSIVVEDFDRAETWLRELVKQHHGYVAGSDVQGMPNQPRRGTWTVRVPAEAADDFREALAKLGEVRHTKVDSQDITDAYYDTQAELTNLEAREKALRKLYESKQAGTKLSELLEVDRELTRVRGEINTLTGRIKRWDKEVAFTTLTVMLFDRRAYVPPTSAAFGTQLGRTFNDSLAALVNFGRILALAVVFLAPWLVVVLVLAFPLVGLVRRIRRAMPRPHAGELIPDAGQRIGE
jgi:hypothetical protein